MTLEEARAMLPASRLVGDGGVRFQRVASDSRTLRAGDLFVALRGERFDGHDFLPQARAAGAVAALAERGLSSQLPGLEVPDALLALQQLAAAWRSRLHLPLIAVTGSNGKTTVTQMTAAILRAWLGEAAFATQGNLNNHIGVPLMLLRLRGAPGAGAAPAHRAAVLELGMNHAGEIALLARLAQPTIALVNNAQREHLEFMASVEAVARENGSVIAALPGDGIVVIPADDAFTPLWRGLAGARRVSTFAVDGGDVAADVVADVVVGGTWDAAGAAWSLRLATPVGRVATTLHQAGRHNLRNAAAAAACALAAGAPLAAVAQGLAAFEPVAGRSRTLAIGWRGRPATLIDDSYNANPDSVRAAIDLLASLPAPRWLLLGDMGEVGTQGPAFHAEVGGYARERGIETVWAAGAQCVHVGAARHFADADAMAAALGDGPAAASLLVKGSRFMRMEQVVAALQRASAASAAPGSPHAA